MHADREAVARGAPAAVGLTIGQVAQRTGCTAEAIRFYEREGVLPRPARAGAGHYRRYSEDDAERVAFLHRARGLGFTLAEVRELLVLSDGDPAWTRSDVEQRARRHLAQVAAKIAQLAALQRALRGVIAQCRGKRVVPECRITGALGAEEYIVGETPPPTHQMSARSARARMSSTKPNGRSLSP